MNKRSVLVCAAVAALLIVFAASPSMTKDFSFSTIEIEQLTRYTEDRIAFQHIQHDTSYSVDNSLATLLVIKDKMIYLLKDGYDDPAEINDKRIMYEVGNQQISDLWTHKINSKPDFVRITERKIQILKNAEDPGKEGFVNKNFGGFYTSVRDAFIKKHVAVFHKLIREKNESGVVVERYLIPKPVYVGAEKKETQKYGIYVTAKTIDEKQYYAEDADGDGVTETFWVDLPDGFSWGYKSGPNIVFIYKNREEDIKAMIGSLANDAFYGSEEDTKGVVESFPKDSDIIREFDLQKAANAANTQSK